MGEVAALTIQQARRIGTVVQAFEAKGRNGKKFPLGGAVAPARFEAMITAVSGSFPQWSYTCQRTTGYKSSTKTWLTDGVNLTGVLNTCETTGTAPYTYGNGITITSSSGQCNFTACVIQPIGIGAVVDLTIKNDNDTGRPASRFCVPNSGQ